MAAGVAGRRIALRRQRGGIHSDGRSIFIDPDLDLGSEDVHRAVVAQASLIAAGSLDTDSMRRLARAGAESAQRYLGLEVIRASYKLSASLPNRFQAAVAPYAKRIGGTASADESLRRALSRSPLQTDFPPPWFGVLRPTSALKASKKALQPPSESEVNATKHLQPEQEDQDAQEDEAGERSRILEMLASPMNSWLGSALQRIVGAKRTGGGSNSGMGSTRAQHVFGAPTTSARMVAKPVTISLVNVGGQTTRGVKYPEWDYISDSYRDDWCTVGDFDPALTTSSDVMPTRLDPTLLRALSRLAFRPRPRDGELLGDELDLTALVDFRASVTAGTAQEPRVYRAHRPTVPELGILVLLDASDSTAQYAHSRSLFDEHRHLAYRLTAALDRSGARVATYAFYSRGRSDVRMLRCKSFSDRWTRAAERRLLSLIPKGFTRMGTAIRYSTHELETRSESRRRLLIVISDGVAYDDGYEGRYAIADCVQAIEEARARAVGCIGISTRPTAELSKIWLPESYCISADSTELARQIGPMFGAALRACGTN